MRRFDYILFDMDGTLTNPGAGIKRCMRLAMEEMGLPPMDDAALDYFIGPPPTEAFAMRCGLTPEAAAEATRIFRRHYARDGIFDATLYSSVKETLSALKQAGCELHVATSKPTVFAERVAAHFGLAPYFAGIAGSNTDNTRSQKREVIAYALENHPPKDLDRVVMIGDRKHDLIGARACGIAAIGVTFGYGSRAELEAEAPLAILDSLPAIAAFLLGKEACV